MAKKQEHNRYRDKVATENTSFAGTDDDDPDHFVEKVITPRVRSRPNRQREHRPPSFEEATRESSTEHSDDEDTEDSEDTEYSNASSIKKKRITSSEEESSYESESESETESEEDSRRGDRGRRPNRKDKKKKKNQAKSKNRRPRSSTDGETSSYRSGPRDKRGPPAQPATASKYPQGQYIPVMAGHPTFQPIPMVSNYPPPQYPVDTQEPRSRQPDIRPTDPPVYSYLVRRGYNPIDPKVDRERNSPASSIGQRNQSMEEPDLPLQSGVEYMRR